jgi:hypothetical protein
MPNHCDQQVYIHGDKNIVEELYNNLKREDPRFCDLVIPMPLSESENWYEWRWKNWGTKWDVVDVDITDGIEKDGGKAWFTFRCWTAWGAPIPVWDKLHAMGIEVQADYQDEGGMFEGEYHHGEDRSWQPEIEEEGIEDTINIFKNLLKETVA